MRLRFPDGARPTADPVTQATGDKLDARAFAILFRRENEYLRIAKTASSPDDPKRALNRVIPSLFQLDTIEAANFEQLAAQYEQEIQPIRAQLDAAVAQFHRTFPSGHLNPGIDPRPPENILALRAQIDAVTLVYRDRFQNVLEAQHFQAIQANLRNNLGVTSTRIDPSATGHVAGGAQ